jgi:hypothetical protein
VTAQDDRPEVIVITRDELTQVSRAHGKCSCPSTRACDPVDPVCPRHGYANDDTYDDDERCSICGGHPDEQECDDPIQCCDPRCDGETHPCSACNGTGLAKHQWLW